MIFQCFDFERLIKCLGEDFLGSLETGVQAGVRGRADRADEGTSSYSKSHDEGWAWGQGEGAGARELGLEKAQLKVPGG